ncbi:MAG TPA: DNA-directed RNA polymerase subunit omega [Phycisphaerae bacterium]|nr:DNA-directed RNA polymerase subunit omega [Phycisphaerae bacterium]
MIEALKSDDVVNKVGGRFKLAVLVQRRLVDVTFGAPLLVERGTKTLMEAVIQEILEDKVSLEVPEPRRGPAATAPMLDEDVAAGNESSES